MTALSMETTARLLPPVHQVGPPSLAEHLQRYGELSLPETPAGADALEEEIAQAGLTGRGGGGFPTAVKWELARSGRRRPTLVVNAMEGEPASHKDRMLVGLSPHLVLDGVDVVASAIGAREVIICIADDKGSLDHGLRHALQERGGDGRTRTGVPLSIERPPGRYIGGEESALISWLEDGEALPSFRWDKAQPLQLRRRSVLVQNVETVAQSALIARFGASWFRQAGTPAAPGTTLLTVSGSVASPGVLEIEQGVRVDQVVRMARPSEQVAGVLLGGYGGAWLGPDLMTTPYEPDALRAVGATQGVGVVVVIGVSHCGIAEIARIARYMAGESAGQCGPCVLGLPAIADDVERLATGRVDHHLLARLERRMDQVEGRGACRHPDGVVRMVRTGLQVFAADAAAHAAGRPCAAAGGPSVLVLPRRPRREVA